MSNGYHVIENLRVAMQTCPRGRTLSSNSNAVAPAYPSFSSSQLMLIHFISHAVGRAAGAERLPAASMASAMGQVFVRIASSSVSATIA